MPLKIESATTATPNPTEMPLVRNTTTVPFMSVPETLIAILLGLFVCHIELLVMYQETSHTQPSEMVTLPSQTKTIGQGSSENPNNVVLEVLSSPRVGTMNIRCSDFGNWDDCKKAYNKG